MPSGVIAANTIQKIGNKKTIDAAAQMPVKNLPVFISRQLIYDQCKQEKKHQQKVGNRGCEPHFIIDKAGLVNILNHGPR